MHRAIHVFCALIIIDIRLLVTQPMNSTAMDFANLSDNPHSQFKEVTNQRLSTNYRDGEFIIDTNIIYIPAFHYQLLPSIAFDGTNFFVVWEDWRNGSYDVYGARITQNGVVLDPAGISISSGPYKEIAPSVAFDGMNYLVVWEDYRNSDEADIYGTRISQEGVVLDTGAIAVSAIDSWQWSPQVTFNGSHYMIVWTDYRNGSYDIFGTQVDIQGAVIDSSGILIRSNIRGQFKAAISNNGNDYMVTWCEFHDSTYSDIYAARVNAQGVVLDTTGIPVSVESYDQQNPAVAFDGIYYCITWGSDRIGNGNYDLICARLTRSGGVIDTCGIVISAGPNDQSEPYVSFDGDNYLIAWQDNRYSNNDIYAARMSRSGTILDTFDIIVSSALGHQSYPNVIFGESDYLIAWVDQRYGHDIYGARVNTQGVVLDYTGLLISTAAYDQHVPAIAFDGTNYLAVWEDNRNGSGDIYGARIDQNGAILDCPAIPISTAINNQVNPAVTFDGVCYLVVWQDHRNEGEISDIYGARINQMGTVLDPDGIIITDKPGNQGVPDIAFDGTNYMVIWLDGSYRIFGTRVDRSGMVLDTAGILLSIDNYMAFHLDPTIAFGGAYYLAAWTRYCGGTNYDVYGTRVSPNGFAVDSVEIPISTAPVIQCDPSVAFDGIKFFIVWQDHRDTTLDVYGARVNQAGVVLDPDGVAIKTGPGLQYHASALYDGSSYFVFWEDGYHYIPEDIHGAKLDTSGRVIDSFVVVEHAGNQKMPTCVYGSDGNFLLLYEGFVDSINNHTANTMRIWGKFYPFIGIEEDSRYYNRTVIPDLRVYPNPIREMCTIKYCISRKTKTRLSIYDVAGRLVEELIDQFQNGGAYQVTFTLRSLAQGVYFIKLKTDDTLKIQKVIVVK